MKKIYNILLLLVTLGMLWSCKEDDQVILQQPESFVLNVPKYASGIYDLQNIETIEFTTSQPEYGFTAVANYSVEISQIKISNCSTSGSFTSAKFNTSY